MVGARQDGGPCSSAASSRRPRLLRAARRAVTRWLGPAKGARVSPKRRVLRVHRAPPAHVRPEVKGRGQEGECGRGRPDVTGNADLWVTGFDDRVRRRRQDGRQRSHQGGPGGETGVTDRAAADGEPSVRHAVRRRRPRRRSRTAREGRARQDAVGAGVRRQEHQTSGVRVEGHRGVQKSPSLDEGLVCADRRGGLAARDGGRRPRAEKGHQSAESAEQTAGRTCRRRRRRLLRRGRRGTGASRAPGGEVPRRAGGLAAWTAWLGSAVATGLGQLAGASAGKRGGGTFSAPSAWADPAAFCTSPGARGSRRTSPGWRRRQPHPRACPSLPRCTLALVVVVVDEHAAVSLALAGAVLPPPFHLAVARVAAASLRDDLDLARDLFELVLLGVGSATADVVEVLPVVVVEALPVVVPTVVLDPTTVPDDAVVLAVPVAAAAAVSDSSWLDAAEPSEPATVAFLLPLPANCRASSRTSVCTAVTSARFDASSLRPRRVGLAPGSTPPACAPGESASLDRRSLASFALCAATQGAPSPPARPPPTTFGLPALLGSALATLPSSNAGLRTPLVDRGQARGERPSTPSPRALVGRAGVATSAVHSELTPRLAFCCGPHAPSCWPRPRRPCLSWNSPRPEATSLPGLASCRATLGLGARRRGDGREQSASRGDEPRSPGLRAAGPPWGWVYGAGGMVAGPGSRAPSREGWGQWGQSWILTSLVDAVPNGPARRTAPRRRAAATGAGWAEGRCGGAAVRRSAHFHQEQCQGESQSPINPVLTGFQPARTGLTCRGPTVQQTECPSHGEPGATGQPSPRQGQKNPGNPGQQSLRELHVPGGGAVTTGVAAGSHSRQAASSRHRRLVLPFLAADSPDVGSVARHRVETKSWGIWCLVLPAPSNLPRWTWHQISVGAGFAGLNRAQNKAQVQSRTNLNCYHDLLSLRSAPADP